MSYIPVKLHIDEAAVKRLLAGQTIRLSKEALANPTETVFVTKTVANRIQKCITQKKGMHLKLSNKLLKKNLHEGGGIWDSLKSFASKAWNFVKPAAGAAASKLGDLAAEQGKQLLGKAIDKGEQVLANKLNNVYNNASDKISNYGRDAKQVKKEVAKQAVMPAKTGPKFADPNALGIKPPEFDHKQMKSALVKAIREAPKEVLQDGGALLNYMKGRGFWSSLSDFAGGVADGFQRVIPVKQIVSKVADTIVDKGLKKLTGGNVKARKPRKAKGGAIAIYPSGNGITPAGGSIIPAGGVPVVYI